MKVFVVEGNIGSGKSTLLSQIKSHCTDVIVIQEPVDKWDSVKDENNRSIFSHFYSDPEKFAFLFQMNILASRIKTINDACNTNPQGILIFERSIMTDKHIFVPALRSTGTLTSIELQVFESMYSNILQLMNFKVDGIIYLQCDPIIAHQRITKRNRTGEEGMSIQYLETLHEQHEKWLLYEETTIPVSIINNNSNTLSTCLQTVRDFIK